jgi:TetR/AcrR family transcriptional regulator, transcriptional repressor for nem operon
MPAEKQFDVEDVLEKAMAVFWLRGYASTSVQDLVEATGVNRASLYATYKDKHSLFLAALRLYSTSIHFKRLAEFERRYAPLEAIRRTLLAFTPHAADPTDNRGCFLTNTALELSAHDPLARDVVAQAQRQTQLFFERLLRKAKRDGSLPAHVKPAEAAEALLASLIGVSVLNRSRPEPALVRRIALNALRRLV